MRAGLDAFGDAYAVDPRMVRGLDYYNRTTFELLATDPEVGSQNAVAGGGRYDALVEMLGGRPTPAVGFAIGLERLAAIAPFAREPAPPAVRVFVMAVGAGTLPPAVTLCAALRARGIPAELDGSEKGFKAKFKRADRSGALFAAIIGEDEAKAGTCAIKALGNRPLPSGEKQVAAPLDGAVPLLEGLLA